MHYTFILNPAAGNGTARRLGVRLERRLKAGGWSYELEETRARGHAAELAGRAAASSDVVVAIGGDGTVQEVARGLVRAPGRAALGVVPVGTGNDFYKMLGIPGRWEAAIDALSAAQTMAVDYGRVRLVTGEGEREHVFVNALGIGFDAQAAINSDRYKRLPGSTLAYLAGVFQTLKDWTSPRVMIRSCAEDGSSTEVVFDGGLLLASIGNGRCVGGGFYLTPGAAVDDGWLDLCLIRDTSVRRILQILPRALRERGGLLSQPEVSVQPIRRARLAPSVPVPVHADGEILTPAAEQIEVEIVPGGIRVIRGPRICGREVLNPS